MDDNDPLDADSLDLPPSRDLDEAAALLAYAAPERRPPAHLKESLMAALHLMPAPFFSKRRMLSAAAAMMAAILFAVIWARIPGKAASLVAASGGVTVDGRIAAAGTSVGWGSEIEVPPDGEAVVRIGDRAGFALSRGGRASLSLDGDYIAVRQSAGWLLSAVKSGTHYAVVTDHSRISALGTDFLVKVREGRAYTCICHGRIRLAGDFPEPEIASQAHAALSEPLYSPGTEGGMEGHADEDIARLRALIQLQP